MLDTVGEIYSRFNPRTYIRYDCCLCENARGDEVSIHVPI